MSAEPPGVTGPDSDDPTGMRYPNTARIWNYQLGGKDNYAIDRKVPATGTVTATLQRVTSTRHRGCPSVAPARRSGRRIARVERHLRAGRSHLTITGARRLTPGGYVLTLRGSGWNATVAFWVLRAPAA